MNHRSEMKRRRRLVTIVGRYSEDRVDLARALLDQGAAVTLCAGPPACAAVRGDSCPLLETNDLTVMLPVTSQNERVVAGLSLCAQQSKTCIVMEPTDIPAQVEVARVRFTDMMRAADFVAAIPRHPSSL